eukprot:gene38182-44737_t
MLEDWERSQLPPLPEVEPEPESDYAKDKSENCCFQGADKVLQFFIVLQGHTILCVFFRRPGQAYNRTMRVTTITAALVCSLIMMPLTYMLQLTVTVVEAEGLPNADDRTLDEDGEPDVSDPFCRVGWENK